MRTTAAALGLAHVLACTALGQNTGENLQRIYQLTGAGGPQKMQEVLTVLRTVLDVQTIRGDSQADIITLQAPPATAAACDWLVPMLDQQPGGDVPAKYSIPGGKDDVLDVYYLTNISTPLGTQEALTQLRTTGRIAKVFNVTSTRLLAIRGTSADVAFADWLLHEIDIPVSSRQPGIHSYPQAFQNGDQASLFMLPNPLQPIELNATVTAVRDVAHVRSAFQFTDLSAIGVRGTADQLTLAAQIAGAN